MALQVFQPCKFPVAAFTFEPFFLVLLLVSVLFLLFFPFPFPLFFFSLTMVFSLVFLALLLPRAGGSIHDDDDDAWLARWIPVPFLIRFVAIPTHSVRPWGNEEYVVLNKHSKYAWRRWVNSVESGEECTAVMWGRTGGGRAEKDNQPTGLAVQIAPQQSTSLRDLACLVRNPHGIWDTVKLDILFPGRYVRFVLL